MLKRVQEKQEPKMGIESFADMLLRRSPKLLNVLILVGTFRKVMSGFTLSDGTELPTGTYIGTNVQDAVIQNSTLENPAVFDGFR